MRERRKALTVRFAGVSLAALAGVGILAACSSSSSSSSGSTGNSGSTSQCAGGFPTGSMPSGGFGGAMPTDGTVPTARPSGMGGFPTDGSRPTALPSGMGRGGPGGAGMPSGCGQGGFPVGQGGQG